MLLEIPHWQDVHASQQQFCDIDTTVAIDLFYIQNAKYAKCKRSKRIPPYCGIKTKVSGFRKGHQWHTASEAELPETNIGVWLPMHYFECM